jgi:hypothetical protein
MALPQHMKAQVSEDYKAPYVFTELPVPELASDDDLLIKVDAAGVIPSILCPGRKHMLIKWRIVLPHRCRARGGRDEGLQTRIRSGTSC